LDHALDLVEHYFCLPRRPPSAAIDRILGSRAGTKSNAALRHGTIHAQLKPHVVGPLHRTVRPRESGDPLFPTATLTPGAPPPRGQAPGPTLSDGDFDSWAPASAGANGEGPVRSSQLSSPRKRGPIRCAPSMIL